MAKHGYRNGLYAPVDGCAVYASQKTFSIGICELIPKKSKPGYKFGPVKVRVRGRIADSELVYKRVESIISELDRDTYEGRKLVTIKAK